MRLKPLHDWAVIRRIEPEEKTAGGIVIPDSAKDKPSQGIVEAIGPGRYKTEQGKKEKKFIPTVLRPGQRVIFIDYMANDIEFNGEEITLIREDDILGTFEGKDELTIKPVPEARKAAPKKMAAKKTVKKTDAKAKKKSKK